VEANTRAIIELAWARTLGLPDDALSQPARQRLLRVDDSMIMFVSLWRHRVLVGPEWLLESASRLSDRELATGSSLLELGRGRAGRLLGQTVLAYTDRYVDHDELEDAVVSVDPQAVADLERECPPDDVAEVSLSSMSQCFVTFDDLDQVTAGAGYAERQGILAELGVLTAPRMRRQGRGMVAAAIATNDALDAGFIPQWRARSDHRASLTMSRQLGFRTVGSQTTVLLGAIRA
jgi:hypothetical protein